MNLSCLKAKDVSENKCLKEFKNLDVQNSRSSKILSSNSEPEAAIKGQYPFERIFNPLYLKVMKCDINYLWYFGNHYCLVVVTGKTIISPL